MRTMINSVVGRWAQLVKMPVANSDSLILISGTHVVEGKKLIFYQLSLTY